MPLTGYLQNFVEEIVNTTPGLTQEVLEKEDYTKINVLHKQKEALSLSWYNHKNQQEIRILYWLAGVKVKDPLELEVPKDLKRPLWKPLTVLIKELLTNVE